MRIAIGANHSGHQAKAVLIEFIQALGHEVIDCGVADSRPVDYPEIAFTVGRKVGAHDVDRGILIGGTGLGMCIASNKIAGVRAVPCHDDMTAEISRHNNDSNVLCLSACLLGIHLMRRIVEIWLNTPFDAGRHQCRLDKLARLELDG